MSASTAAAPARCSATQLQLSSEVGKASYSVGDKPLLQLQVINTGAAVCVADLADSQVVMRVYNGASRVWDSHDCQIQPGTMLQALAPRAPVRVAISWSGLTSSSGCHTTRQRVDAGTYTLYTTLAGKSGRAAQFAIR